MHQGVMRRPILSFRNNLVQMYPRKIKPIRSQNMNSHEVTKIKKNKKGKTIIKNKNTPPVISQMEMNCFNFFLDF